MSLDLDSLAAAADAARAGTVGALSDEELGADAAYAANHIEAFKPDFVKVLTRYNPAGDREMDRRQAARPARTSDWLAPRTTKYCLDLIVVPERPAARGAPSARRRWTELHICSRRLCTAWIVSL